MKLAFIRSIDIQQMAPYLGQIAKTLDRHGIEAKLFYTDGSCSPGEFPGESIKLPATISPKQLADAVRGWGADAALARKGWPAWRIKADLARQDIDVAGEAVAETVDLDEAAQVRRLAQRKRLGPYRPGEREPYRDRDIRALVRAGFPVGAAKRVVDGEAE